MNKLKLLGLVALAGMSLSACGALTPSKENSSGSENNSLNESIEPTAGWSAEDLKIINDYLYGIDLPFISLGENVKLEYDELSGYVTLTGGTSSKALLDGFALLFDATWDNYSTAGTEDAEDYGYYYDFGKEITTSQGARYVEVMFGGLITDEDGYSEISSDGTGTFYLQAGDPYYYEWPEDIVTYYTVDEWYCTDEVPAYNADFYQVVEDYTFFGMLVIYAFTDSATAQSDYAKTLLDANYYYVGLDDYGYARYVGPNKTVEVDISYDTDYKDLDIIVMSYEDDGSDDFGNHETNPGGGEENPIGGSDVFNGKTFGFANPTTYYDTTYTSSTTGAKYVVNAARSADGHIQLRSKNQNSGIVTALSGGTITSIVVEWDSATLQQNLSNSNGTGTLNIYASNTPFTISDMYSGKLDVVGSINFKNNETRYTFTSEYAYVGVRSDSGALYIKTLTFNWTGNGGNTNPGGNPGGNPGTTTHTALSIMKDICDALFGSSVAEEDFYEDGGMYFTFVDCEISNPTDDDLLDAVEFIADFLPEYLEYGEGPVLDEWDDGTDGAFAVFFSPDLSISVELGSFVEDGDLFVQIATYNN